MEVSSNGSNELGMTLGLKGRCLWVRLSCALAVAVGFRGILHKVPDELWKIETMSNHEEAASVFRTELRLGV